MKTISFYASRKDFPVLVTVKSADIEAIETGDDGEVIAVRVAGHRWKMHPIEPRKFGDPWSDAFFQQLVAAMPNSDTPGADASTTVDYMRETCGDPLQVQADKRVVDQMIVETRRALELTQDCALAARLMTEALTYFEVIGPFSNGAVALADYMREFIRSYEHVIDLRRET